MCVCVCGQGYCAEEITVSNTFVTTSETMIAKTFKLATVQVCQLNREEPREVKHNSKNFLKTNG